MASPDLTAGEVMNKSAALLNDTARSIFTYTKQLPYLNLALQDLRKLLELSNAPVTNETSAVINVPAGVSEIGFTTPLPYRLPKDLIEIQKLWERTENANPFISMQRREVLPKYLEGVETNKFLIYVWSDNKIKVLPCNQDNDLKIDYIKNLFTNVTSPIDQLSVINADSYLEFRTAALCAEFIGENPTRAISLNMQADAAFNVLAGIDAKGKQEIYTRRRPFRSNWKRRGWF